MDKNQVKIALVTLNTDDTENLPEAQVQYMGKAADVVLVQPYGLTSRPPKNQSLVALLNVQGQEQNRVGIPFCPLLRKKGLSEGEAVLENMLSGSFIYMREDGTIVIEGDKLEINAPLMVVNVPIININGTVSITGGFFVNGKNVSDTHTHPAGIPPGNTGTVN